jgi:hypothetical protein
MSRIEFEAEWTSIEIDSLKAALGDGLSMAEAAEVLDRTMEEIIQKCRELRLPDKLTSTGLRQLD